MEITRVSLISGKSHTRDIDVTADELARWHAGVPIQDAMPHLTPDEREFLITGITPDEWDSEFKDDEE